MRKVIDGCTYLKHIIELLSGDWEYQLDNINEFIPERNQHQQEYGKASSIRKCIKMIFVNILGVFFCWFPLEESIQALGGEVTYLKKGITHF